MEELRNFFENPRPSNAQITKLKPPLTNGFRITKDNPLDQLNRQEDHRHSRFQSDTDYARAVKEKEKELYMQCEMQREKNPNNSIAGGLESLEQLSTFGTSVPNIQELSDEAMLKEYSKYSFQKKEDDPGLPISSHRQDILDRIKNFPVVIIQGQTGCGKTTQVPQWILDDCYKRRRNCKIIVTQPRKIAAISIAKRVAQERGWDLGGPVGYQVGLDNTTSSETRISYVTTGVLLQKLTAAKTMNEYTHVILDEVHERGQEMDFLLLVVRKLLHTVSHGVNVVLMSATFDSLSFADYFKIPTTQGQAITSVYQIEMKKTYEVKNFFLDHLEKFNVFKVIEHQSAKTDPSITPEMNHLVVRMINAFEKIDAFEDKIEDRETANILSVLVFLPGINEIEDLFVCLTDLQLREKLAGPECASYKWWVLPLHSTITADEQVRVFQRAPPGHRKIILATNIAESSITVPDIRYVIDYCMMKMLVADENTNFTSLQLHWASKTNCEQRAGRCGRVREGRVYKLVTERFYEGFLKECLPEMRRCPLERLVLLAKMLDMGPPKDILALAMDPPEAANIYRTILVLKEMGALRKYLDEKWSVEDGDITYLGQIMAKLPLDVRASKLILLGHVYGCLEECIIMAAAMSVKNVFSSPFRERLNAYNSKLTWADGSTSDCIALYNAYRVWTMLRQRKLYKQHGKSNTEGDWARRFYVQLRALKELDDLVREIKMRLSREHIEVHKGSSPWDKNENAVMMKIIMAGAVYPQYFVQLSQNEDREREAVRTLGGLDPRNTVYLKNFPQEQPGALYAAAIKKTIRQQIGDEPRVTFDKNSQKVYLTFEDTVKQDAGGTNNDPTIPGQVLLPVYKAIKTRQLKMDIRIPLLPKEKANEMAAALEMEQLDININKLVPRLPDIDDSHIHIKLAEIITVNKFWVHYNDGSTASELSQVRRALNSAPLLAYTGPVKPGLMAAGPYMDTSGTTMHRVRVLKVLPLNMVEVIFIDYGTVSELKSCNLQELPRGVCADIPPLAMQCTLAGIAPSPLLNQHAQWSNQAWVLFNKLVAREPLFGKVFSVTHGVVSIELLANNGEISVNERLLENGYAVPCEESYDSKMNHDLRETVNELSLVQKRAFNREQQEMAFYSLREVEPPNIRECIDEAHLHGPFSPLETIVHSLMYATQDRSVVIEWNSVNSVLLDTEPQETYQRMLVAAEVGQNETSSKITLRHTTLMPNIPGLPAIISLIFCPTAELRRDSEGTRYVSALCGLGSDKYGNPYFPEHDLLVNIDADLDVTEIGEINHIRYLMDFGLSSRSEIDAPSEDSQSHSQATDLIRKAIIDLLRKKRTHRESQTVLKAWEWKSVPEQEFLDINLPDLSIIFPLHKAQDLHPLDEDKMKVLQQQIEDLKAAVSGSVTSTAADLTCKLCNAGPMPMRTMRIHLYSNAHREKEAQFYDQFNSC